MYKSPPLMLALVLAAGFAYGQSPDVQPIYKKQVVFTTDYGRSGFAAQRATLSAGYDSTSHFFQIRGDFDKAAYSDNLIFLAVSAGKANALFPWGDRLLVDPLQIAAIIPVPDCFGNGYECGLIRFRPEDLAVAGGIPLRFYLQAFVADMAMEYPFLTSHGLDVKIVVE